LELLFAHLWCFPPSVFSFAFRCIPNIPHHRQFYVISRRPKSYCDALYSHVIQSVLYC
jgi:hypothetical protein